MSTDPKKNDEIKDEQLEMVSGGAKDEIDEQPDGDEGIPLSRRIGKAGREQA